MEERMGERKKNRRVSERRTGTYAIATVYKIPWSDKKKKKKTGKNRKKHKNKIVNSIFYECSENIADPYWKKIFENASRGKFPRGFMFRNGVLTHKKGNKIQRLEIVESPIETLTLCISFFQQTAGLMSEIDKQRFKKDITQKLMDKYALEKIKWNEIKKEKIRELLIDDYIEELSSSMELDIQSRLELITLINKGFLVKQLSNKDIIFEKGKVISINGLIIDKKQKRFWIDPKKIPKKIKLTNQKSTNLKDTSGTSFSLIKCWKKYLENLNKKNNYTSYSNLSIINSASYSNSTDDLYQHESKNTESIDSSS